MDIILLQCSLSVIHPKCGPLALRLSAVLLLGITRIHNVCIRYSSYSSDNADIYFPIQMMYLVVFFINHTLKL